MTVREVDDGIFAARNPDLPGVLAVLRGGAPQPIHAVPALRGDQHGHARRAHGDRLRTLVGPPPRSGVGLRTRVNGHFFIEKNKPATFKYPAWSFISDWKMLSYAVAGRMGEEVARHEKNGFRLQAVAA